MKHHRGYTLIELLGGITVTGALAGLGIVLLQLMLSSERIGRQGLVEDATVIRLAESLRRDVRAAVDARITPAGQSPATRLTLNMGQRVTVEYVVADRQIQRTQHTGNNVSAREVFGLRQLVEGRFVLATEDTSTITMLEITRGQFNAAKSKNTKSPALRIEALLAADHRWNNPLEQEQPHGTP